MNNSNHRKKLNKKRKADLKLGNTCIKNYKRCKQLCSGNLNDHYRVVTIAYSHYRVVKTQNFVSH